MPPTGLRGPGGGACSQAQAVATWGPVSGGSSGSLRMLLRPTVSVRMQRVWLKRLCGWLRPRRADGLLTEPTRQSLRDNGPWDSLPVIAPTGRVGQPAGLEEQSQSWPGPGEPRVTTEAGTQPVPGAWWSRGPGAPPPSQAQPRPHPPVAALPLPALAGDPDRSGSPSWEAGGGVGVSAALRGPAGVPGGCRLPRR